MYQKPTVPRTIGGVLDDTFQLYKSSLPSCWLPALLVSVITGLLSYFIVSSVPLATSAPLQPAELLTRYRVMFSEFGVWYLVVIALSLIFYGMLIINIGAVSRGEVPQFGTSLSKAARRSPALLGASILFFLAITVGFILFIIPGFYVWNRMQLYMVPLVTEDQGPAESLGASWRLVGGNWWRTATVVGVVFIILIVLEMVVGAIVGVLAVFGGAGSGLAANPVAIAGRVSLFTLLVGAVVRIVTTPLVLAAFVALYQDLVLRKGGADLEARLGALPKS